MICCQIIVAVFETNMTCGVNKLVPNLGNKSKYVFYNRNLQLYLSLGMKLVSVQSFKI